MTYFFVFPFEPTHPFIIFSSAALFKIWHKGARLTPRRSNTRRGFFASDDFVMQMGLNGLVVYDAVSKKMFIFAKS